MMKKDDYKTKFEEHRQTVFIDEEKNVPSRFELRQKGRKPKKSSANRTINIILALFTLIPVAILVYVLTDFYEPQKGLTTEIESKGSYEINNNLSSGTKDVAKVELVIDDEEKEDSNKVNTNISKKAETEDEETTSKSVEEPVEKTEVVTTAKPVEKPVTKPVVKPQAQSDAKTHIVAANETLYRISINYYKSDAGIEKIKKANGLSSNTINAGQKLIIP
ncbi:LysM peptidoglycan-binding domain-containing protein [Sporosarcina sp. FA9]|uniref:LysM peptidoglycan-binding domain-containing protein n=1 Tax=Sporosarcina sp. FA9 TaxID=3413030 RepID=UPI003F660393